MSSSMKARTDSRHWNSREPRVNFEDRFGRTWALRACRIRLLTGDLRTLPLLLRIFLKLQVILQPEERNLRLVFYPRNQQSTSMF